MIQQILCYGNILSADSDMQSSCLTIEFFIIILITTPDEQRCICSFTQQQLNCLLVVEVAGPMQGSPISEADSVDICTCIKQKSYSLRRP